MLNLVFSSIECMIGNVEVCEPFSYSDYNIMTLDLSYVSHITTWKEYYFDYRKCNYNDMDNNLQSEDWDALFLDNNVNETSAIFIEVSDNAVSKFVPRRKRRT